MMWRHKRHTNTPPFKPADSGVKNSWDHGQVWRAKHGIFPTASASCFGQISCTPVSHRYPRPFWSSNPRHLRAKKRSAHLHFLSQVNSRTEIILKKAVKYNNLKKIKEDGSVAQVPINSLIHYILYICIYTYGWLSKCCFLSSAVKPHLQWDPLHKCLVGLSYLHSSKFMQILG